MLFLLLTSLFFYSPHLSLAYEDPRFRLCRTTTAYAANSTFAINLSVALMTLRNTTAATGFNATTVGNSSVDSVTALALCRASMSSQDCQTCVDAATLGIRNACPSETMAQVWYTLCMVRYSRINFINKSDSSIALVLFNTLETPDPKEYDRKVKILIQNLSYAAGVSDTRSAVAKTSFGTRNIYGYKQPQFDNLSETKSLIEAEEGKEWQREKDAADCTRDINGSDCTTCLLNAGYAIPSCCSGKWAGWIATPTCSIQFNIDPIDHDDWMNNPPEINTDISPALGASPVVGPSENGHPPHDGRGRLNGKETSIVVAVVVSFILTVGMAVRWRVRRGKGKRVVATETESIGVRSFVYDLDVLVAATDNFSPANRLGGGGFGSVYRGKLASGEEIAVKKLRAGSMQGIAEFLNEVTLLVNMQHRNLVKLLGCYGEGEEMMLVYEYLPNRSLDYFLFDKSKSALLDWTKRFNIIMGVTRRLKQEGRLMELVDVTMGSFPQEDVLRCIQIGLLCCKESVQDRPTIYSTLVMLTDNSVTLPLGHQDNHIMMENAPMSPESFSNNSMTVSLSNGR
ncbi:Cysteine-rich receptor-like protein kinase [Actinidia chinensis var. chinensis]|uniref:Cysteine-rich receptor-like protein kinase n=1 Tax=Actinidia chinensis var. chinensis TaxID=1590841 RepID=A0A2R6RKN4_ACTCC|nr:Cysteine-rich receptor-like protein kinase [Actinidia chinensis var. chinensis]